VGARNFDPGRLRRLDHRARQDLSWPIASTTTSPSDFDFKPFGALVSSVNAPPSKASNGTANTPDDAHGDSTDNGRRSGQGGGQNAGQNAGQNGSIDAAGSPNETARAHLAPIARVAFRREFVAWTFMAISIGAIEGGTAAVIIKNAFASSISSVPLNFCMAFVSGAGAYANLLSFAWTALSQGRHKVKLLVTLKALTALALIAIAFAPVSGAWAPLGLFLFVAGACAGQILWSGIVNIRSGIWRANYPRRNRAAVAGAFITVHAAVLGLTAIALGALLDTQPTAFRWAYPLAALCALAAAYAYRRLRVQRHDAMLRSEKENPSNTGFRIISAFVLIVRSDRDFALYLCCMFIFGSGNLMMMAPAIAVVSERMALPQHEQMLMAAAIPMLAVPLGVRFWSRFLNKHHVIGFRARHAWSFVLASALIASGCITSLKPLLFAGAGIWGFALGGGKLGWNLGHHDFASPEQASQYMGLHMTLTGLRGLIAPLVGIAVYQVAEHQFPSSGRFALLVPLFFTTTGAFGFVLLNRWRQKPRSTESAAVT